MTKEELLDLLKDNLSVQVKCGCSFDSEDPGRVEVEIWFGDELVCRDRDSVNIPSAE